MEELNLNVISEKIESKIYLLRGKKVMLDRGLADLYDVGTKILNQSVKRNLERFPVPEFMFQLNNQEFMNLKSQIVTSSWGGVRKLPYAFTEMGVAMLSSVLKSNNAIQVNIQIMKTFTKLREIIYSHDKLWSELKKIEAETNMKFDLVFEAIRKLQQVELKPKMKIGFGANEK